MWRVITCLGLATLFFATSLFADEQVRRVQEELRRRNIYYGDVDGRWTPELANALAQYQARKGLQSSGKLDGETANALHVSVAADDHQAERWPDVPVLKSDAAREISEAERATLQVKADLEQNPPPPAESPNPAQNLTVEQVAKLLRDYLHDAEMPDIERQVSYYVFPVEYFDHGRVNRSFVIQDTRRYCERWPRRHYDLIEPVTFFASSNPDETVVHFTIAFAVERDGQKASGKTLNTWKIKPTEEGLRIVSINEQRVH